MRFLRSVLSRFSHKHSPVVATNMSIDSWCHHLRIQPTRFITKIEMCTALATGKDAWWPPIDKPHPHTLLRVSLVPTPSGPSLSEDILIERVLSTEGVCHSVAPLSEAFSYGGSFVRPEVHDRICVVSGGPSTALTHRLEVERTLVFGTAENDHRFGSQQLTLAQFAQILDFVSRMTTLICAGGDCKHQSRSFAFTCLAALTPSLPPPTLVRKRDSRNIQCASELVDDSVFESGAETFLGQVPWLVRDRDSVQAVSTFF